MRKILAGFILGALPMAVGAAPYDGIYRQAANAECGLIGVDGAAIEIRDGIFYGVESQCRMTRPVDVLDMDATLFTMQCSGEDQQWTERAMIMTAKSVEGIIMVWDGYAFIYERCPAETTIDEDAATGN